MIELHVLDKNKDSLNIYFDNLHFKFYKDKKGIHTLPHSYEILNTKFEKNPLQISIPLGYSCPNKCVYCAQRKIKNSEVNIDKLLSLIKYLSSEYSTIKKIHFIGGEPLIEWETIKYIVCNFDNKFKYSIITNGLQLDLNKALFLVNNNFKITLSHDGESHSLQRGNDPFNRKFESSQVFKYLSEYTDFGIESILCGDVHTTRERWDYFNKLPLNISNIHITPVTPYKKEHISLVPGIHDWNKYFNQLIDDIYQIPSIYNTDKGDEDLLSTMLNLLINKNTVYDTKITRCPIFNDEFFTVNPSGRLQYCYNCDKQISFKQTEIYMRSKRLSKCVSCPVVLLCTSSCRLLDDTCFKVACNKTFYHHLAYFIYFVHQVFGYYITHMEGDFCDVKKDRCNINIDIPENL